MKRSEANLVLKARLEFSTEYDCVSPVQDEDGEWDEYFSHRGCDICSRLPCGGAGSVIDVHYRARVDLKARKFDAVYEGALCGGCLCALVNGDDSDLDFSVTEEDV
jgi:hypothetical protein